MSSTRNEQLPTLTGARTGGLVSDPATRAALSSWRAAPGRVLRPWLAISCALAVVMLVAVWLAARAGGPGETQGLLDGRGLEDLRFVLERNVTVLALHAFALIAAYMAAVRIPAHAAPGAAGRLQRMGARAAMAAVAALLTWSALMQVRVLGDGAAALAAGLGIGPGQLLGLLSVHALPELAGMYAPLAAWAWIARAGRHEQMLAAAVLTSLVGGALILAAACVEVWVTPALAQLLLG